MVFVIRFMMNPMKGINTNMLIAIIQLFIPQYRLREIIFLALGNKNGGKCLLQFF